MKYNKAVVARFYEDNGIGLFMFEHPFHPTRKWRFDLAWIEEKLALEVQGGIWVGGHNRGAQLKKDYEKANAAAELGWRILYFEPKDLCLLSTVTTIKNCL